MKKIKNILLTAVIALSSLSFTFAQSKVAHVDTSELSRLLPEAKTAMAEMEKLSKTFEEEVKDMVEAFQAKLKQYEAEQMNQTPEENQKRQVEISGQEQSIQGFQQQAQAQLQKRNIEYMTPITEKLMKAINDVADELGIDYVLDSTPGALRGVIRFQGEDITEQVKVKLGL